jgi:hypothetical protein
MPLAGRVLLRIARVALVSLFWMSPCAALGAGLAQPPEDKGTPVLFWIFLAVGILSLVGAWMVDRKLRPHVRFWRKHRPETSN